MLSAVLHPLFKTSFIENNSDERKLRDILKDEFFRITSDIQSTSETIASSTETDVRANKFFVSFQRSDSRRSSMEYDIDNEITRYLADNREHESILHEYPTIKRLFFRYNTTLSSSAPVERVFSQSKLIFRPQRNRLSAENFERALFLKINASLLADI